GHAEQSAAKIADHHQQYIGESPAINLTENGFSGRSGRLPIVAGPVKIIIQPYTISKAMMRCLGMFFLHRCQFFLKLFHAAHRKSEAYEKTAPVPVFRPRTLINGCIIILLTHVYTFVWALR